MPHPIIHSSLSNPEANQKPPKIADCLSCRLWGGVVHVGIAGFVASHIKEMQSRGAKGFLIAFSSGVGDVGVARVCSGLLGCRWGCWR